MRPPTFRSHRSATLLLTTIAFLGAGGCVSKAKYDELYQRYVTETEGLQSALKTQERRSMDLEKDSEYYRTLASAKEAESEALKAKLNLAEMGGSDWERRLKEYQALNPRVEILGGGKGIRFESELLFSPGSATLNRGGVSALDGLVALVRDQAAYLEIDGHTDSDPIQRSAGQWKSKSNFELGAYRALSVLLHLQSRGVPPDHMFLCSFGEHRPVDPADKRKNRRVEIYFFKEGAAKSGPGESGS